MVSNYRMKKICFYIISLLFVVIISCTKEDFDTNDISDQYLQPTVDLPILYGEISMIQVFDQYCSNIIEKPEDIGNNNSSNVFNLYHFLYRQDSILKINISDILNPGFSITKKYNINQLTFTSLKSGDNILVEGAGSISFTSPDYNFINAQETTLKINAISTGFTGTISGDITTNGYTDQGVAINETIGSLSLNLSTGTASQTITLNNKLIGSQIQFSNINPTLLAGQSVSLTLSLLNSKIKNATLNTDPTIVPISEAFTTLYKNIADDENLNLIRFKDGFISCQIDNSTSMYVSNSTLFFDFTSNATPISNIFSNVSSNTETTANVNLAGTYLNIDQATTPRETNISHNISFSKSSDSYNINNDDYISLTYTYNCKSTDFEYVNGYLGNSSILLADKSNSINIDLFNSNVNKLTVMKSYCKIFYKNDFSFPFRSVINLTGVNNLGNEVSLNINNGNPIDFKPSIANVSTIDSIDITDDNSDITPFIKNSPTTIKTGGTGYVNYDNNTSNTSQLNSDSELYADIEFDIPLYLSLDSAIIRDTIPFNIRIFDNQINEIKGTFYAMNQFPMEMFATFFLYDTINKVKLGQFKTLSNIPVIWAPPIKVDGRVDTDKIVESKVEFIIDSITANKFKNTNSIIIDMKANTNWYMNDGIYFFSDYNLKYAIRLEGTKVNIKL